MVQPRHTLDIFYTYISKNKNEIADELLEDWTNEVIESGDYGFERGMLGLGWLIGFLIQENYIEGDADEILEDIDDTVYKLTIKTILDSKYNIHQLLHYVTYYQQRLQYKSCAPFYRRFVHLECLKLLLEKLHTFLLENSAIRPQEVTTRVNIALKFTYLVKTCVNDGLVENALYSTIEQLIYFFEEQRHVDSYAEDIAKLYIGARQYEHPYWEHKLHLLLEKVTHEYNKGSNWLELAACASLSNDGISQITKKNNTDKDFLFFMLTNVKINNWST